MEKILNDENDWDQTTNIVMVAIHRFTRLEMMDTSKEMKLEQTTEPSEVNAEMIAASGRLEWKL